MTDEKFVYGECCGERVKVLNHVFFGDTYIEWPNGEKEWIPRNIPVKWPIKEEETAP